MARNKKEEDDRAEKAAKAKAKAEEAKAARDAAAMEEGMREYKLLLGKDYDEDEDEDEVVNEDDEEEEEGAMDVDKEFLHLIGPVNDAFERSVQELQGSCVNAVKTWPSTAGWKFKSRNN